MKTPNDQVLVQSHLPRVDALSVPGVMPYVRLYFASLFSR